MNSMSFDVGILAPLDFLWPPPVPPNLLAILDTFFPKFILEVAAPLIDKSVICFCNFPKATNILSVETTAVPVANEIPVNAVDKIFAVVA